MTDYEIEALLWGITDGARVPDDALKQVMTYLSRRLEAAIGHDVEVERMSTFGDAFSCTVLPLQPLGGVLGLDWRGILGMEPIGGKPDVSATIFLFVHGRRVRASSEAGGSLSLSYVRGGDGTGAWQVDGWEEDVYDEYDGIQTPDDV